MAQSKRLTALPGLGKKHFVDWRSIAAPAGASPGALIDSHSSRHMKAPHRDEIFTVHAVTRCEVGQEPEDLGGRLSPIREVPARSRPLRECERVTTPANQVMRS